MEGTDMNPWPRNAAQYWARRHSRVRLNRRQRRTRRAVINGLVGLLVFLAYSVASTMEYQWMMDTYAK
jgi:hypothetical protein